MLHIKETIVVEGKFDREQLKKVTDAPIICTGGFALYTDKSIIRSIRKFAETTGIIVLTDSDSAGFRIRNYIKQCVGTHGAVKHAYIPTIKGKEKRKKVPGKEGLLGVEGITEAELSNILASVTEIKNVEIDDEKMITKAMLFEDGLSGGTDSRELRKKLVTRLKLPVRLSTNGLLDILNCAVGYEDYKKALSEIKD